MSASQTSIHCRSRSNRRSRFARTRQGNRHERQQPRAVAAAGPAARPLYRRRQAREPSIAADAAALVQAWRTGDTAGMEATATRAVREHPELRPLIEALVYQRNAAMARQVADFLKTSKTRFVVVGSLHLVGDRSILKLLAEKGYRIEQLRVQ